MYSWRGLGSTVDDALAVAASKYGIPLSLLRSVAKTESNFNPAAVSPKGAQGLLQIMPATQGDLGVTNPFDPYQSADGGAKYLSQLYGQYGDWNRALIAYNEGPGTLAKGTIYPGAQSYADSILANAGIDTPAESPADTGSVVDSWDAGDALGGGLSPVAMVGLGLAAAFGLWAVLD